MKVPTPTSSENFDQFMDRCMNNPEMQNEFADQTTRSDACTLQWTKSQSDVIEEAGQNLQKAKDGYSNCKK